MRIPASPASEQPRAQASPDTRSGETPLRAARSRLSTTARMATPMRVLYSRIRSPTATAMAVANIRTWWYSMTMPPNSTVRPAKNRGSDAFTVAGGQMMVATWMSATRSPMGTTMRVMGVASWRRRISTRSITRPSPGAKTSRVTASASGTGRPQASGELSCQ